MTSWYKSMCGAAGISFKELKKSWWGCRKCGTEMQHLVPSRSQGYIRSLRHSSSGTRAASGKTLWGMRCSRCQTSKSLPCVYPSGARRGRENRRAWSGPHIVVIKPDKGQGHGPTRSVADVLYWDTCEKGLGGRHTPS